MATLWTTAALWGNRVEPPLLPLLILPAPDFFIPLMIASALPVLLPRLGTAIYAGLFVWAVLGDSTRLQPQFVSFIVLFIAAIPSRREAGRLFARVFLMTFWFYAGLHKLLSVEFMGSENPYLLAGLIPDAPHWMNVVFPWVAVVAEMGLAVALFFPAARKLAAAHIAVLHLLIFIALSPLGHDWNSSVWAWNLLLMSAGFWLFYNWKGRVTAELRSASRAIRLAAVFMVVYPAGFYLGVSDPYLSHALYSDNIPQARRCDAAGTCSYLQTSSSKINVPLPPRRHVYHDYFRRVCAPGDTLEIFEYRRVYKSIVGETTSHECPVPPALR